MNLRFREAIKDIILLPAVQKLRLFSSHLVKPPTPDYNRLNHSIRIAYFSFKLSKIFLQDTINCARAGLLHDIGFATVTPQFAETHSFNHAEAGARLLESMKLSQKFRESTRTHMFPLGPLPKTVFSFVIWLADKIDWFIYFLHLTRIIDHFFM